MKTPFRRIAVFLALLLLAPLAFSQAAALQVTAKADGLVVKTGEVTAEVSLAQDGLLRVTATLDGATPRGIPDAMQITLARTATAPVRSGGTWQLGPYALRVDGAALAVARDGQARFSIRFEKAGAAGVRTPLVLERGEALYGMGQCAKSLALGEQMIRLYNRPAFGDQTYLYVPWFFGSAGDAFLFQAGGNDAFVFRGPREVVPASERGVVDLVHWQDPDPARLTARLYTLTGSRALLPRWAYGYLQSKYGYRTEAEVRTIVSGFGQFGIPLSGVVLDLYWFSRMGDLEWNRQAFPDPAGLDAWLEGYKVKLLTISEPFFTLDSKLYRPFADAGLFALGTDGAPEVWNDWWTFGGTGGSVVNPLAPGVDRLLGDRYAALARDGVDGFWTDLGEPEKVPASARFGPWSEVEFHQAFNKEWSRIVHDAWSRARPGTRPFILSRSGYLGSTGYGVSIWSGDVPATWDGLRAQVPLGLQAGLSGFPFWGSDAGGFITSGGELLPPDPELYLRWLQFAAFTPVFRAHGMGPREPWIYGEEWLARNRGVIGLRRELLPYVYATAYQVWSDGIPMMRPLFFLDPADPRLTKEDAGFMLGDWLLFSPITQPVAKAPTKRLYLPRGGWYAADFAGRLEGGREIEMPVTLDTLPLYIREGAIVPLYANNVEAYLLVPGPAATRYTAFSDDGSSEDYRTGGGEKLRFTLDAKGFSVAGALQQHDLFVLVPKTIVPSLAGLAAAKIGEDARFWIMRVTADAAERRYAF